MKFIVRVRVHQRRKPDTEISFEETVVAAHSFDVTKRVHEALELMQSNKDAPQRKESP